MTPDKVDDIVASVEDAVRRAYALGRADAMKRVVELAQSDDPGLRAMALLGPAEPAKPEPAPALLSAPAQLAPAATPEPAPVEAHERAADMADAVYNRRQAETVAEDAAPEPRPVAAGRSPEPASEMPKTAGGFLADFFYPIGSKRR